MFFLILQAYLNLSVVLKLQSRPISQNKNENIRRRKALWILLAVTLIFLASWTPLNIYTLISEYSPKLLQNIEDHKNLIQGLMYLLGGTNSIANPILYGYMNENFKKEYSKFYKKMPWYHKTISRKNAFKRKTRFELPEGKKQTGNGCGNGWEDQMKESVIFSKNLLRRLSTNEITRKSPTATILLNYEYNQQRNAYRRKFSFIST